MERLDAAHALSAPSLAVSPAELSPRAVVSALLEGEAQLAKHLNEAQVAELRSLGAESHGAVFWRDLVRFAERLEAAEKLDAAAAVLATAAGALREGPLGAYAQNQLDAIQGRGAFGGRAEFLLSRFTRDATDPKVILPMMAGSLVYGAVRAAALGRLAATTRGAWYAQGFAARLTASSLGFAAEVPTFALSARALRRAGEKTEGPSLGQEFGSAALTLGFLKSFAFAGNRVFRGLHGIGENGIAQRLPSGTRASQFALSQGAMFTGLLAAHQAEEALGWRPQVDGATTITDTLAAMLSLSVGGHLGPKVLGPRLAGFQAEARGRSELASRWTELAPGLRPLSAIAQPAPGGMLLSMSTGSGRGAEPSGGDPSRIIRDLRIDLTSKDAKPKARRKALGELSKHLTMQLPGIRQSLGLGGVTPFLAALGLGLETLLAPNTALAGPLEPLVSGNLNLLLLGATAAISAALGFWAGWRARSRNSASSPTEVRKSAGSIYRVATTPGFFNFLAELNPKRLQVTAFHENGRPRKILFTKPQTIQSLRFSAGFTAVVDAEGRLMRMRAAQNLTWHDAIYTSDCRINDTTIPPEADIFLTETGALAYVQLPFGFTKVGAYNTVGPSQVHFHENGRIKSLISSGHRDDPLRGRYGNKYVFFDQNGKFLGAGEKLSDYDNYVKTPERLRIAAPPREKDQHPGDESPATREAEAEREAEASEARSDRRGTSG